MSMSESAMGAHGQQQALWLARRLLRDADAQAQLAGQDADPLVALIHNVEAHTNMRAAKRLGEETNTLRLLKRDFVDALAKLQREQDLCIQALAETLS